MQVGNNLIARHLRLGNIWRIKGSLIPARGWDGPTCCERGSFCDDRREEYWQLGGTQSQGHGENWADNNIWFQNHSGLSFRPFVDIWKSMTIFSCHLYGFFTWPTELTCCIYQSCHFALEKQPLCCWGGSFGDAWCGSL